MQTSIDFTIEYPLTREELGLTLEPLGRFVIVSQSSAQSEQYGVRYQDRIITVNDITCTNKSPEGIVNLIRRFTSRGLTITFRRSFKPEEMDGLNKLVNAPLQNDCIFYEGHFLFRLGFNSSQPFSDKAIRIVRITGPLLQFAEKFHLIPFGIALLWYNSPNVSNIPYENQPAGAQNLLPCQLDVRPGTNGFFIVHFSCANNILITSQEKERLLEFIEAYSHISNRDVTYLIKAISVTNPRDISASVTQSKKEGEEEIQQTLDFSEEETRMTNRNLRSTLNIPYPLKLMEYVQHLYDGQLSLGLYGIKSNLKSLLAIGFHPEQISHSLIALFINCKQFISESDWDESIQKTIQEIIVEIAKHNAEYIRTSSAHPSGFCVFRAGDPEVCGTYMATRESFGDIPVFVSSNGCRLFRQIHMGRSTWILQKKDTVLAAYYIHSTDVIPPRFNWNTANAQAPVPIIQAITDAV